MLIEPGKEEFKYSIIFKFSVTNNVAEYEALFSRLRLIKKIRIRKVVLFTKSHLIARQVLGEYEVRDPLLAKYHSLVRHVWENFEDIKVRQISREENTRADELSKLDPFDLQSAIGVLDEYLEC